ncbi:MAG TPA: endonuclease/exonuclease/phosphatase family protein [Polyangiaceae bacterium]|jgi:endonuclease/exonuclease/phosphatase family metal-dependent hydrolase
MELLRVATLNIWNRSGPWPERLALIRAELERLRPDVIGLQEVLRLEPSRPGSAVEDQAAEIAEGGAWYHCFAAAADYGNGLFFGNALLSRFPILEERGFSLPGAYSGETRSLLFALVETPKGRLPAFVTHLNWKYHHGSVRLEQVRFIADTVAELAPEEEPDTLPAVLMGDFNADPDSDEIRYLRGLHTVEGRSVFFTDAWSYVNGTAAGFTFDRGNEFAARAHEPSRRIDYIFVRGPDQQFRGEPLETRVVFHHGVKTRAGPVWPSDHFGLVTDLRVTGEKAG